MIFSSRSIASAGGVCNGNGSIRCSPFPLCVATQLGESGHRANRPSATPKFEGRRENKLSMANARIGKATAAAGMATRIQRLNVTSYRRHLAKNKRFPKDLPPKSGIFLAAVARRS